MNNINKIKSIFFVLSLLFVLACTKDRIIPSDQANPSNPSNPNLPAVGDTVLKLNEFMADNDASEPNPDTALFSDWFEIYNPSDFAIDLAGYFVSDDSLNPTKCKIPSGSSSTIISAKGFKIIWCDDAPYLGPLHVQIGLKNAGESIALVRPDTTFMDFYKFGVQTKDVSEGRIPNGSGPWTVLPTPTPGSSNN
jgi:hypothetical protein